MFRDKSSAFFMILAVTISVLTVLNTAYLRTVIDYENETGSYEYTSTYLFSAVDQGGAEENKTKDSFYEQIDSFFSVVDELSDNDEVIITLNNIYLLLGGDNKASQIMLYVTGNEEYKARSDGMKIDFGNVINGVYIGTSHERNVIVDDGKKYIDIEGIKCPVLGILENTMASGDDESVLIKWKNLSEDFRSIIISTKKQYYYDGISFEIMCDDIDFLGDNENNAIRLLMNTGGICEKTVSFVKDQSLTDMLFVYVRKSSNVLSLLFALVNCVTATTVWRMRKRREYVIRRIYGETGPGILKRASLELCLYFAVGFVVGTILFFAINWGMINYRAVEMGIVDMALKVLVGIICIYTYSVGVILFTTAKKSLVTPLNT